MDDVVDLGGGDDDAFDVRSVVDEGVADHGHASAAVHRADEGQGRWLGGRGGQGLVAVLRIAGVEGAGDVVDLVVRVEDPPFRKTTLALIRYEP